MTEKHIENNLFLAPPKTDLSDYLEEVKELAESSPEILQKIDEDLDEHARTKKHLRIEDKKFAESKTLDFPTLEIEEKPLSAKDLKLETGRPRMSAYLVFLFMMLRGFMGSFSSKTARCFLNESITMLRILQEQNVKMPGVTTILENVNKVSEATRKFIFDQQIAYILKETLDDFKNLTIDSTAVKANSCWPTDSKILIGLLERAYRLGQKLELFELANFHEGWCSQWLATMHKLDFGICLIAGKPKSKGNLKKKYRQLFRNARKAIEFLTKELEASEKEIVIEDLSPGRRVQLLRVVEQIRTDLADAQRVLSYAYDRVIEAKILPSKDKVLSLSDGSAAFIKKGDREPVIGYKPQLVRSEKGFVTTVIVPEGNAADSSMLFPCIQDSIKRTAVIAETVSTDDGYASAKGKNGLLDMGVKDVSISGAKGKRLTDEQDWNSELYQRARSDRSAVESLMFTIKDRFGFGELGRRGIDAVRCELLEKVLAYNCCRIILIRNRQRQQQLKKSA